MLNKIETIGRHVIMPELFVAVAMIMLFWMTIIQPENIAPQEEPGQKAHLANSPEILKEAMASEPAKLLEQGKPDLAIKKAHALAESKPHDVLANLAAGNVLFQAGSKDEGFRLLKRSVALAPRSRFVRINFADKLAEDKRYDEATVQYQSITSAYPHWARPHEALAKIMLATDHPIDAADQLDRALETEPNNADLRMERGLALARGGQAKKGLDEYVMGDNTALASGPPADVKQLIGYWGSLDRAVFELRKQIEERPVDAAAKVSLGRVMMYTGQISDAKQLFMDARKKAPSDPDIHRNLALILQRLGDSNQALSEWMLSTSLERNKERQEKAQQ